MQIRLCRARDLAPAWGILTWRGQVPTQVEEVVEVAGREAEDPVEPPRAEAGETRQPTGKGSAS